MRARAEPACPIARRSGRARAQGRRRRRIAASPRLADYRLLFLTPRLLFRTAALRKQANRVVRERPMSRMIFVNLPVTDLARSKAFYEAIGFRNEPKFSNEAA